MPTIADAAGLTTPGGWDAFFAQYYPLVRAVVGRRLACPGDADDAAQEVMVNVFLHAHKREFDPAKGRVRNWLLAVARNAVNTHLYHAARRAFTGHASGFDARPAPEPDATDLARAEALDAHRAMYRRAKRRVAPGTKASVWESFERTAMGEKAPAVARSMNSTPNTVYVNKCRTIKKLRAAAGV